MSSVFQADIIEDYKQLYESEEGYDVKIYIGEDGNDLNESHAHSAVLRSRSTYFCKAFSDKWMKKQNGIFDYDLIKISNQDPTIICPIAHQGLETLAKKYLETVCQNPEILFESDIFSSLEEDVFTLIIKSDELAMDEIKIWNSWPFKKIIPEEFVSDILNFYLVPNSILFYNVLPPRISPLGLILIGKNHTIIFANWIEKYSTYYTDYKKLPYKFELIFRRPNIVVAKIKDSQRFVGGYNPLDWNGIGFKSTSDSFIFSIDNLNDMTITSIARMRGSTVQTHVEQILGK
ncbi:hypothetical protein Glove_13g259 [Diversispora epigaea]|uniref:BTB domain-containing protein n=1 Tax=Diversispora epigaea TaxID=1348612 RepID=A0A397JXG4_9GLOM|nr:hypothetical protein Glove_13g259 [Diversispora epigaea]